MMFLGFLHLLWQRLSCLDAVFAEFSERLRGNTAGRLFDAMMLGLEAQLLCTVPASG